MEDKEEIKNTETEEQEIIDKKITDEITTPVKEATKKTTVKRKSRSRKKQPSKKTVKPISVSNFQKPRQFPKATLEECLQVPLKIKELNGGNPWDTEDVANALGLGAKSNNFYYLTAAARDFGLTIGTRGSAKIELADLGKEIVYAPNPQVEHEKKIEAFLKIEVFKKVLDYYKGSSLPEMKYLRGRGVFHKPRTSSLIFQVDD